MPSDTDTTVGLVLLNVVMYAFAYQLQRPVEPFLICLLYTSPSPRD